MKVRIDGDDSYVYYLPNEGWAQGAPEIEVPDEKVADWKRVAAEFDRIQEEMMNAVDEAHDASLKAKGFEVTRE